ncbi:OmpA family protein [Albibacterium sp.]|uniref:OmpA family protein n=1 Tax=Albibacterium sp. TaxID=2952885 RepID=UPI002CBB4D90|nr:OmpA family protein [Albibacterium sp.]HUH19148.1 OmpA family protein [Albibacterium sp.]
MKILRTSFLALIVLSVVACNNQQTTDSDTSMNDSIANSNNNPPSRDLSTEVPETNLENSKLTFTETNTQLKLQLPNNDIFEEGTAIIKDGEQATLEEAYKTINERGVGKVLITGNSGREGDVAANTKLSSERAIAVVKWMNDKGLKKDISLSPQGAGDRFPMVSYQLTDGSPNPQANELNDRIEITFRKSQLATE